MLTRTHLSLILFLAVGAWGGTLWLFGLPLSWDYFKPYSVTLAALTAAILLFEKWIWHWRIFKGWLVKRPYIQGTWKANLHSSYIDPETGNRIAPIDCIMSARQTFSTLSMRLITKESKSVLVASKIQLLNDGVYEVVGVYQNDPEIHLRGDRSEIHYGALKLQINGDPPTSLDGHYWTDRETKGSLQLTNKTKEILNSYEEGASKFEFESR